MYTTFEEMKSYVGFNESDCANLRDLSGPLERHLPNVVRRFYDEILKHPGARQVFAGGEAQVVRLREHLHAWLRSLFTGRYDEQYVEQRSRIGEAHVRVGLPQRYMFTAMEVIWQELRAAALFENIPEVHAKLASLHKLLTLDTGLMLESFKASYSSRIRDLERAALEERLSRSEHLAEIGQMAASLAHELKNPLAGISGAIQVIRDSADPNDPQRPILEEILRQIIRLDGTVKDLLLYARPRTPAFAECHLREVVGRAANLMQREPSFEGIRFHCGDLDGLPAIHADEHQIEQMLVNLLLNAAHASKPGDSIWLRVSIDDAFASFVVQDQGTGMPDEIRLRAFEPFYTTKARGTGLGLPICRRIVDAHRGSILIESEQNRGTVVTVRLPLRTDAEIEEST